jgi:hypothetical protein
MAEPLELVPGKTDTQVAKELRAQVTVAADAILAIMDRANAAGFVINFAIGKAGVPERNVLTQLIVAKHY